MCIFSKTIVESQWLKSWKLSQTFYLRKNRKIIQDPKCFNDLILTEGVSDPLQQNKKVQYELAFICYLSVQTNLNI